MALDLGPRFGFRHVEEPGMPVMKSSTSTGLPVAAVDDRARVKACRDERHVGAGHSLDLLDEADRLVGQLIEAPSFPVLRR